MTFSIERGLDIPRRAAGERGGRPPKYPFGIMKVGDSFVVEGEYWDIDRARKAATNFGAICHESHRGKKFVTRRETNSSIRIWRSK